MTSPADPQDLTALPVVLAAARRVRGRGKLLPPGVLRFAFYGRMSTSDYQHHATSYQWQFDTALHLITGHGTIVAQFFDDGSPRSLDWHLRPQASALLAAITAPGRAFDAIVVGEFERAFYAGQLQRLLPYFIEHGIQVWLPEIGGPLDPVDPVHQALMLLLGHQSEREILRFRFRASAAMQSQVRDQGRYLGGRPPYGYRLVDAGPHPNAVHARWGRRLRRLDPDPVTAPHVRWIFRMRLAGCSTSGIARTLNMLGIPSPSAHDRARNPHRDGTSWTVRTVAAILANPRYTGKEVWNRQRTDHHETRLGDKNSRLPGRKPSRRWNPPEEWVFSTAIAHPPLVSEADFLRAQRISAVALPADGNPSRYRLTGLVICGECGRRAEGHWSKGLARYRCRHGVNGGSAAQPGRMKTLYVREDQVLEQAAVQYTNLMKLDSGAIPPVALAAALRRRGITVVCTKVSITLDFGEGVHAFAHANEEITGYQATPMTPPRTIEANGGAGVPRQRGPAEDQTTDRSRGVIGR
ncbi:recombinase family protein [Actinoplanes sp. NPDC020271]|uniref:recombinase family protein n=1 Tax=Actinoplanes sp. NPDC020271 TaxID=3363896 RepID=UPI0037BBDC05